jgi:hypothetical protein
MMQPPFFIIGAQRSGTTLLRLLLNAHPEIAIPEEGTFWMPLLRKCKDDISRRFSGSELKRCMEYLERNKQFQLWGIAPSEVFGQIQKQGGCSLAEMMHELYKVHATQYDKRLWGDKTPSFFRMISVLKGLFPDARFIHIIRDGRDVYLSWRQIDPSKRNIAVTALEWSYKVSRARKELSFVDRNNVLELKYEDLTNETADELKKICSFLQVDYDANMLNFWRTSRDFLGSSHSRLISKPITRISVNRWQRELTSKELNCFEYIAGSMLESLGYRLSQEKSRSLSPTPTALLKLSYGLPMRATRVLLTALLLNVSARFGLTTSAAGGG